jgi:hypothetical protein
MRCYVLQEGVVNVNREQKNEDGCRRIWRIDCHGEIAGTTYLGSREELTSQFGCMHGIGLIIRETCKSSKPNSFRVFGVHNH